MSTELTGEKLTLAKQNEPGKKIIITQGINPAERLAVIPKGNNDTNFYLQFHDSQGPIASIGYEKLGDGKRYLHIAGPKDHELKQRTKVQGELHVTRYDGGTGSIWASGNVNSNKYVQFINNELRVMASLGFGSEGNENFLDIAGGQNGGPEGSLNRWRKTRLYGDLRVVNWGIGGGNIDVQGNVQAKDVIINSSQELKQDISNLTKEEAYSLLEDLEPVKFAFKNDPSKKDNIGFIAEHVPEILSANDHKSVRYMEIISALTKVVKEQGKVVKEQGKVVKEQAKAVKEQEKKIELMFREMSQMKKNIESNSIS
jgi:hypothetical protein